MPTTAGKACMMEGFLLSPERFPMAEEPTSPNHPHRDPATWGQLIESLDPKVLLVVINSWMSPFLKRECSAEDILQETLMMAWRDRDKHTWQGARSYRAWLLGIAKNRIRVTVRDRKTLKRGGNQPIKRFSGLLQDSQMSLSGILPAGSTTPSRVAVQLEQVAAMEEALADLPAEYEAVVRMRYFEDQPIRKVAQILGIGLTTAKDRFFLGARLYRELLRRRLQGDSIMGEPE